MLNASLPSVGRNRFIAPLRHRLVYFDRAGDVGAVGEFGES
jgi:hypothetical protein